MTAPMNAAVHLVALVACHNRREKTLAALAAYFDAHWPAGRQRSLVLLDDASQDGTAAAVAARFPQVVIEHGDGHLFWNRGMLRAWQRALPLQPTHVLWLNDDTLLHADALQQLFDTLGPTQDLVVGATHDDEGRCSYGGLVRGAGWHGLDTRRVPPAGTALTVDTMNGNCVLVPAAVWRRIGLLDPVFSHAMGDHDYGLRARAAGVVIRQAPRYVGRCVNDTSRTVAYRDATRALRERWRQMRSPRGLPLRPWFTLCRRHAGWHWPLVFAWPYAKLLASAWPRPARREGALS